MTLHPLGSTKDFRLGSLVLPFYIPSALAFLGAGMVMPLLALYARHLGASVAVASVVVGLFGFGGLLFNVPAGFLITRFGRRRVILLSTFLEGSLAVVLGFSQRPVFLAGAVFVLGAVHTVFFVSRLSFFRALVPREFRGRALALIGGENRFGQFLGPIAGGLIAESWGYRYTFWAFAILMFVSLFFLCKWIPPTESPGPGNDQTSGLSGFTAILRENRRVFATAGVAVIVLQLLRTARQALIPLIGESMGLQVSQIGFVVGIMFFAELVLFYPAGIIMDRWGRKTTAVPCLALLALGLGLLPLAGSYGALIAAVTIAGIGNGLGSGINMTLSTDFAPSRNPGEFIGVWRFVVDVGTTGGPFLVGAITAALSLGGATFIVASIGFAGALVMGLLVPEPLHPVGLRRSQKH